MSRSLLLGIAMAAALICRAWSSVALAEGSFEQARPEYQMQFPRDFGSHPTFQTEWWYYTGQLARPGKDLYRDGPDYGFQLTFFRRAEKAAKAGDVRQGYLAHAALLDLRKGVFYTGKRVSSEALGLAGSALGIMRVWNRDWKAETFGLRDVLEFNLEDEKVRVRLIATYAGQPVLHGEQGFSRKGQCQSCASQYFSLPGMQVEGQVEIDSQLEPVQGVAWMDHEFMSNALEESQSGWDWFSLLFKDGRKLMLYQLRARAGGISYASGTLVSGAGTRALRPEEFSVEVLSTWASRKSGATYPARWRVRLPSAGIDETIVALYAEQEILGDDSSGITYWEGAVRSESREALGYVEMTGYQSELGAKF